MLSVRNDYKPTELALDLVGLYRAIGEENTDRETTRRLKECLELADWIIYYAKCAIDKAEQREEASAKNMARTLRVELKKIEENAKPWEK